jgi:aspartate kinase
VAAEGHTDISFTVFRDDLPATLAAVEELTRKLDVEGYSYDENLATVSVVGMGMATQTGVAEKMFRALAEKTINILMITTSEIKISVLVSKEQAQEALSTVHEIFELHKEPADVTPDIHHLAHRPAAVDASDLVAKIELMEDLIIEDITLDESQSMVTVMGLADSPGLAARLFEGVAEGGILVDMIVQSMGREGHAGITFTVPRKDLEKTIRVTTDLAAELGCPPPTNLPKVAKLSVCGIGMRSHTSVAERMFKSLASTAINVEVISTSEVHVNIVVEDSQGKEAFETLQREFEDVIV